MAAAQIYNNGKFEKREVPGKGFGLVATDTIAAQEIIIIDQCLATYNKLISPHELFKQDKELFKSLAPRGGTAAEKFMVNSFGGFKNRFGFMFPKTIVFANHDCNNNCVEVFFGAKFGENEAHMALISTRNIAKGEELTIFYNLDIDHHDAPSPDSRIARGFTCSCGMSLKTRKLREKIVMNLKDHLVEKNLKKFFYVMQMNAIKKESGRFAKLDAIAMRCIADAPPEVIELLTKALKFMHDSTH